MSVYTQVIEIIFNDNFNARTIALELAKQHPTIFLKLCGVTTEIKKQKTLDQELKDIYNQDQRTDLVAAVRFYRQETGAGLKEALDYVKKLVGRE